MKVIQINCVYGRGSTGTLVRDIHRALLERGGGSLVIYGRGAVSDDPGTVHIGGELYGKLNSARARLGGLMYGGCEAATGIMIRRIRAERPDVVHLHCINGNFVNIYRMVSFLKKENIPTVLTLHAEFMYTANCSHAYDCDKWQSGCGNCPSLRRQTHSWLVDRTASSWRKLAAAFDGFKDLTIVSVSPWQENRAKLAPFFSGARFRTIMNGVDVSVFHPSETRKASCDEVRRVLYVTPHFDRTPGHVKGGEFLYPLAERLGSRAVIAAAGVGDWGEPPANVKVIGPVWDRRKLAELYSSADVTLLTSRRETFSMVTAESLCCGTPVVGFRAGGPESIAIPAYSAFCSPGDVDELADAVMGIPLNDPEIIAEAAENKFNENNAVREYLDEYEKAGMIS